MTYNRKKIKGATMTEYVLIVGLIAAGAVLALTTVGTGISGFFTNLNTTVSNAAGNL
jgi:Flp pilus assembly pilin Flp